MTRSLLILGAALGVVAMFVSWIDRVAVDQDSSAAPASYTQFCSSCHGPEGRDFVGRTWKLGSTPEDIERVIREGYELLGMPAYGDVMYDEAVAELTAYVLDRAASERSFKQEAPAVTVTDDLTVRANVLVDGLETTVGHGLSERHHVVDHGTGRADLALRGGKDDRGDGHPTDIHVR